MNRHRTNATASRIELEGVRVHNLKNIDLTLPLGKLIVISGVSGSGKSSLAFDTLYAEGQRRYIECFSAYARQFLDRLEKPDADRIDHIPPAIAIRQHAVSLSGKSTVATATELHDYLRLLFAKIGRIVCPDCRVEVVRDSPETVRQAIQQLPDGVRFQICFPFDAGATEWLTAEGFRRVIVGDRTIELPNVPETDLTGAWAVVDRLTTAKTSLERIADSVELAFHHGRQQCIVLAGLPDDPLLAGQLECPGQFEFPGHSQSPVTIDSRRWAVMRFSGGLSCSECGREFLAPEPRLFSFGTPLGACPECSGFGSVPAISLDHLVPDASKSLREGAIVPWTSPAYRHELDELLDLADDYYLPVDVPFSELGAEHRQMILDGVAERSFGGLKGFFRWLERHKYKLSVRVFLNRWRAYEPCPACAGDRLQPLALAVRINGLNIADVCRETVTAAADRFGSLSDRLSGSERDVSRIVLTEIQTRLRYLREVGLGYLTLDRRMKTLSSGEAQRVLLTATLGSNLVNTLYVLDEPSAGLHPRDSRRVIDAILRLRDAGNTVVVVEHEDAFIKTADEVVDIGPLAGRGGGRVVYQGPPDRIGEAEESITGAFLAGRRTIPVRGPAQRRKPQSGCITLFGARQHNLKNLTVEFPLGVLCVVTGVSGSGKSTLIHDTLYPAVCRALRESGPVTSPGGHDRIEGVGQIDGVVLVDQTPISRTPRSNPVTYLKAFDAVRHVFAETPEAKLRGLSATSFSFNAAAGGRCPKCNGAGSIAIDMQFLADVSMTCPECHGTRFRDEILEVTYRNLSIADVLDMTVAEAFTFFRGQPKLQRKLKVLKDAGLDYLPLGQPATTLSGGESQRLKLASFLASGARARTLFLIDEPTTGLHRSDVAVLLECFDSLLSVGHSLVVIEHNLDVIRAADHVIDLGPEAGDAGGEIVACGTPEVVAGLEASLTGRVLRESSGGF